MSPKSARIATKDDYKRKTSYVPQCYSYCLDCRKKNSIKYCKTECRECSKQLKKKESDMPAITNHEYIRFIEKEKSVTTCCDTDYEEAYYYSTEEDYYYSTDEEDYCSGEECGKKRKNKNGGKKQNKKQNKKQKK